MPVDAAFINATVNDCPATKDLHIHVVSKVAHKWKDLGIQLLDDNQQNHLKIIEQNYPADVEECCKQMLSKWRELKRDASWSLLIEAFKCIDLDAVAADIEQKCKNDDDKHSKGMSQSPGRKGTEELVLITYEKLQIEFAKITDRIKQALCDDKTESDVHSLIQQLSTIPAVKDKQVPLFDSNVFENVKTIEDLWRILRNFWSIRDYDILKIVVEIAKSDEANSIFEEFLSMVDSASLIDADLVISCKAYENEELLNPVLRIKLSIKECTQAILNEVKKVVSKKYKLEEYSLSFKTINKGCIELVYAISKAVASYLLEYKLIKRDLVEYAAHDILSLQIGDMKLTVPSAFEDNMDEVCVWSKGSKAMQDVKPRDLTPTEVLPNDEPLRKKIKLEGETTDHINDLKKALYEVETKWQQLQEVLTCSICYQPLIHPYTIPCLHIFCKKCIEKRAVMYTHVHCPTCAVSFRKYQIVPMPSNASIDYLFKVIHLRKDVGPSFLEMKCNRCSHDYSAALWCKVCHDVFCQTCKHIHDTWPEFKSHDNAITTEEYLLSPNDVLMQREASQTCNIHADQLLDQYCATCSMFICNDCAINDHCKHNYDCIDKAIKKVDEKVQQVIITLQQLLEQTKSNMAKLETCEKKVGDVIYTTESNTESESTASSEHKLEDIANITITAQKEKIQLTQSRVSSCLEFCRSIVNTKQLLSYNNWMILRIDIIANQLSCELMDCTIKSSSRVGFSIKLVVALKNAYGLPVKEQSKLLKVECKKEKFIQNVEIEEQLDGLYHILYIPKRIEKHGLSIYWKNDLVCQENVEIVPQEFQVIDRYTIPIHHLQLPYLLATGPNSELIFSDDAKRKLVVFNSNFEYSHTIGGDRSFEDIRGVTVNQKGVTFVADQKLNCIQKFELNGKFLSTFGVSGKNPGEFQSPHGLLFSQSRHLFVCDRHNHRIQVFKNEKFVYYFGQYGTAPSAFNEPVDLALNNNEDQLFVTDCGNHKVQVFNPRGQFLRVFGGLVDLSIDLQHPVGIYCTADNHLLISSYDTDSVLIFNEDESFHSFIKDLKKFNSPCGVVMINRQIVIASHLKSRLIIC